MEQEENENENQKQTRKANKLMEKTPSVLNEKNENTLSNEPVENAKNLKTNTDTDTDKEISNLNENDSNESNLNETTVNLQTTPKQKKQKKEKKQISEWLCVLLKSEDLFLNEFVHGLRHKSNCNILHYSFDESIECVVELIAEKNQEKIDTLHDFFVKNVEKLIKHELKALIRAEKEKDNIFAQSNTETAEENAHKNNVE